jgi:hypothetical protein
MLNWSCFSQNINGNFFLLINLLALLPIYCFQLEIILLIKIKSWKLKILSEKLVHNSKLGFKNISYFLSEIKLFFVLLISIHFSYFHFCQLILIIIY